MKSNSFCSGSALILVVVLTSLLAVIGTLFLMSSRVTKMETSSIAAGKDLNLAVHSIVAQISRELVLDVPGVPGQEYYDYPDPCNAWLANLEPYNAGGYKWRHISDIYRKFAIADGWDMQVGIIPEYQERVQVDVNLPADADGDGVADSRWVVVPDFGSHKGKAAYAAVRVVDNGGMLNVNTAYIFDPNSRINETYEAYRNRIDGSGQTQINLMALAKRGTTYTPAEEKDRLDQYRCGSEPNDIFSYQQNVVWQDEPLGKYTPFDISDELKLRYRYLLNYNKIMTRIEKLWTKVYDWGGATTPFTNQTDLTTVPDYWFCRGNNSSLDIDRYDYRHIGTIYNADRIIDPCGVQMLNINSVSDVNDLYDILASHDELDLTDGQAAQLAVNIKDCADSDSNVTVLAGKYGFERPCIYLSEIAFKFASDPNDSNTVYKSYGIELRRRYRGLNSDIWKIVIEDPDFEPIDVTAYGQSGDRYHVTLLQNPNLKIEDEVEFKGDIEDADQYPEDGETGIDPAANLLWDGSLDADVVSYDVYLGTDYNSVRDANTLDPQWQDNVDSAVYDHSVDLTIGQTYYWRVDDVNAGGDVLSKGDVWEFTVGNPQANVIDVNTGDIVFNPDGSSRVELHRYLPEGDDILVDWVNVPGWLVNTSWVSPDPCFTVALTRSFKRDINRHKCIRRLWDEAGGSAIPATLGYWNNYWHPDANMIQARPFAFDNVGDVGKVFRVSAYDIGYTEDLDEEAEVRLNLIDPNVQQMFKYITVIGNQVAAPSTTKIKGRININTAPWYVLAQLPWVSQRAGGYSDYSLAKAIVAYRDRLDLTSESGPDYYSSGRGSVAGLGSLREAPGFESIGELTTVINTDPTRDNYNMHYYSLGANIGDQLGFPDLTTSWRRRVDGVADDFEERDLIFARISDLVTVRSDVFTAYILVRIGRDGPQKRVIAILDRSGVTRDGGKVKIIALHPVPDPR